MLRISNKQLYVLLDVFKESLSVERFFTIPRKQRIELYNEIINQQSDEIKEIRDCEVGLYNMKKEVKK